MKEKPGAMTRRIYFLLTALALLGGLAGPAGAAPGNTVVMRGLDKVTARVMTFEVKIGESVNYGTLLIKVRACDRTPPTEPPESKVFLDIYELKSGELEAELFHGWMFASSPALNPLEHPVYDVWVLECLVKGDSPAAESNSPVPEPKP